MRLVLLTNNRLPPREGIGHHLLGLARALAARGHRVRLVGAGPGSTWQEGELEGLPLDLYPRRAPRPLHHLAARALLARRLAQWAEAGWDRLHVHLPLLPPLDVPQRVVVTVHTPLVTDTAAARETRLEALASRLWARAVGRRWERFWLARAERCFCVSSRVARELAADHRLASPPPVLVNGVELAHFPWPPPRRREPIILYLGRLGPRKGLFNLLRAFALLPQRELTLELLGEGPLEGRLRRLAHELGIARRVRFAGFADRVGVLRALARCRLFVLPSTYEGLPLALLEALAAGAPVVTTPACALPEFGPKPPFLVARPPDPAGLAAAMAELLDSPERERELVLQGRALIEARFTWPKVAAAFERQLAEPVRQAA